MEKKPDSTTPKRHQPETDISSLQDVFDEQSNIDQINNEISSIDEKILDKKFELARSAISVGDLNQAQEISKVLKDSLPKGDEKAKEAYNHIQEAIQIRLTDIDIQKAIDLYKKGEFLQAQKILGNTHGRMTSEQKNTIDSYQKILQEKQEEIDKQRKQEMITEFPNILMTKSTKEIQNHIDEINDTISKIHDENFIERHKNFPNKEIYEALQKCYIGKKMETFNHIIALNYPLCNTIKNIIKTSLTEDSILKNHKKDLDELLSIHRPILGVGNITIDPLTEQQISDWKRFEGSHKSNTLINAVSKDCEFPYERYGSQSIGPIYRRTWERRISIDGKYILIAPRCKISKVQNLRRHIDRTELDTTNIDFSLEGWPREGFHKLKRYLKGKRVISWETYDGYRVLEIVK